MIAPASTVSLTWLLTSPSFTRLTVILERISGRRRRRDGIAAARLFPVDQESQRDMLAGTPGEGPREVPGHVEDDGLGKAADLDAGVAHGQRMEVPPHAPPVTHCRHDLLMAVTGPSPTEAGPTSNHGLCSDFCCCTQA